MKTYVELSLVAVLIVLLYQPPTAVIDFAKSGLGKAVLIISIVAISHQFGMNAGLLSAIIGVVLLNHHGTVKEDVDNPNKCNPDDNECHSEESSEQKPALTESHKAKELKAAAAAGVQIPGTIPETFSNYTIDDAADYPNLKSTLTMLDTNENIKRSMRAAEYAKTAPAGSPLMTNHLDTVSVINKQSPLLAGM